MNPPQFSRRVIRSICWTALVFPALAVLAQPTTPVEPQPARVPKPVGVLAGRPDAEPQTELLGERYENKSAGISFRPPAGSARTPQPTSDEIVEFRDDARGWLLRVTKATFPTPVPLKNTIDKVTRKETIGLLNSTLDQLKKSTPGAQILRGQGDDIINVDANYVGIVALRFSVGTQRYLRQQALVQANEQLYYIINLTVRAGKLPAEGADAESLPPDPGEKLAVDTFMALLDSVKLLDRAAIKEDQNQRLYRTRALFLYWTPQRFAAIKEKTRYLRYIIEGKDVGYSYIEEMENDSRLTGVDGPGAVVYERSHRLDHDEKGQPVYVDTGSFKFMSFDRTREAWTRVIVLQNQTPTGLESTHTSEFADSKWEQKMMYAPESGVLPKEEKPDTHAPLMRPASLHVLNVRVSGKGDNAEPLRLELPPFYLPAAGQHFLPRLAINKVFKGPRTYLFASYMPESHDIRLRYVDVSAEGDISFAGRKVLGNTVTEKVGLEGNPTVHYVAADGQYLGSETRAAKLVVLPADEASILKLWPDAKLTRPDKMRHDAQPPADLPTGPLPTRGVTPEIR